MVIGPGLGFNFLRCITICEKKEYRVESLLFLLGLLLQLCIEQIKCIYLQKKYPVLKESLMMWGKHSLFFHFNVN